jgi:membrane protease YdiL (CAAX protease family)
MIPTAGRGVALRETGWAVAALGLMALAGRPVGWTAPLVTAAVGTAALLVPADGNDRRGVPLVSGAVGLSALLATRALLPPVAPIAATAAGVAASIVAAVAEEALFRRVLYERLSRWGIPVAVVGSAVAFAAVHLPAYGLAAAPVNLGAGLLFGWQRWASGGWGVPAATHATANVLAVAG